MPIVVLLTWKAHMSTQSLKEAQAELTLVAKRREQRLSLRWVARGDKLRNMSVFEFPLNEFWSRKVNYMRS